MGRVCEKTVRNRSRNEKRPLSARGIISIAHVSFAEQVDEPLRTPFRNRNYLDLCLAGETKTCIQMG
jgi:hypothetical protein